MDPGHDPGLTPATVERLIERLFPPGDRAAAAELLERYGSAVHEREPIRVRVAALRLSQGELARLARAIERAQRDYRDVLGWAEFPEEMRRPTWRMPADEVAAVRRADRAAYLAWLAEPAGEHPPPG
jgi:hypothetical protein